jgi:hypothetical protein
METGKTNSERAMEMFPEIGAESLMQDKEYTYEPDDQEIAQSVAAQSESFNYSLTREFARAAWQEFLGRYHISRTRESSRTMPAFRI